MPLPHAGWRARVISSWKTIFVEVQFLAETHNDIKETHKEILFLSVRHPSVHTWLVTKHIPKRSTERLIVAPPNRSRTCDI
jgi:hypothetical protein